MVIKHLEITMNLKPLFAFAAICLSQPLHAEDKGQKRFEQLVENNHYYLNADNGKFSGKGLDWLIQQGKKSQYYLVGERHGLVEIPQLSAAIYAGIRQYDFDHAALEISPYGAQLVTKILSEGGEKGLHSYFSSDAGKATVAFLKWREEVQMVADIYAVADNKADVIWGLDQEFVFGLKAHLAYLSEVATTGEQRAAINKVEQKLLEDKWLFVNMLPSDMQDFTQLFRTKTSVDVSDLLDGMVLSNQIYGPWAKPSRMPAARSNIMREELIKQTFIKHVKQTRKNKGYDPKVFFKFGGYHSAPNVDTLLGRTSLGNFVEEFAKFDGHDAFNVMIECSSGRRKTSGQDSNARNNVEKGCVSFFGPLEATSESDEKLHMFSQYIKGRKEVFVVDLRPLRDYLNHLDFLSEDEKHLIASFDAYVAIPNAKDSTDY